MIIDKSFYTLRYNTDVNPDNPPTDYSDLSNGANCLIFAYAILKSNNKNPPILWPIELWEDTLMTTKVTEYQPGDILLFGNNLNDLYWAHATLYIGDGKILHLSKEIGIPELITYQELINRGSYKYLLGAKRIE